MRYYSVPADFKIETIDKYHRLNREYPGNKVLETFGNITVGVSLESGRSVEVLPKVNMDQLRDYIRHSREKGIGFNYTLNASHMNNREYSREGVLELISFLGKLYDAGVRSLTVTLPSLFELIRKTGYDFELKSSVICGVDNANKAMNHKRMGAERIVVDESMNRNFAGLKRIVAAFGEKVEVIVNTICHKDCSYRMFHYNQISSDSVQLCGETSANYYSHRCMLRRYENRGNLMRLSWIRPEDIHYYEKVGIRYFKLQGRQAVKTGDPARAVESYFKGRYDGNLMDLLELFGPHNNFRLHIDNKKLEGFIKPYVENENHCRNDCGTCRYCDHWADKSIDRENAEAVMEKARTFYEGCDSYAQLIETITKSGHTKLEHTMSEHKKSGYTNTGQEAESAKIEEITFDL
jgi:collagenase-like PrtC family protease